MEDILQNAKSRMTGVMDHLKQELKGIRAGRASPSIVEPVSVDVYGTLMRLRDLASISVPESRQLLITPFDGSNTQACAKAIDKANLGVTAVVEGKVIRVMFPELDAKRRADLIAQSHKKREDAKIAIRNVRRDINELLKKQKSDGTLPEDEFKRLEKHVQELTDNSCKEIDTEIHRKEQEISTI